MYAIMRERRQSSVAPDHLPSHVLQFMPLLLIVFPPTRLQLLALWSVVFRELLSTFGYSAPTATSAATEVRVGTGTATMTAAASSGNIWVCTRHLNRASTVTTTFSEGPPSGPTTFTPGSVTVSTSASGILHIPLVGEDSLEDWLGVLELMYPPTCLPRPTIGWVRAAI